MYNKIVMVGNLTRDIEIIYSNSGVAVAKTAIATTNKYKDKEDVCFTDITFFGKTAEIANQYLRKGSKCLIEGMLQQDSWTDKSGNNRSKHYIKVDAMKMLDTKGKETQHNTAPSNMSQTPQVQVETIPQDNESGYHPNQGQFQIDENEVPF